MKESSVMGGGLEALVADLADEFMDRLRRGEQPNPDEYGRRYPEHAAVIAQVLMSLPLLGLTTAEGPRPAAGSETGCLGDYRLIREVGRGGMGVVYEAEQISLGRRVALKVLPFAGALDACHLQRFKNEAQAAACLHHPNIVPVHAVGCERGAHYYAMQFIDGPTLADLIAEMRRRTGLEEPDARSADVTSPLPARLATADTLAPAQASFLTDQAAGGPAYCRRVARLGVQAAEALEHAHQTGIVHRDIKPANLLLDERGNVWITDFGLAQFQSAAPQLTRTGCVLGTLRYMSPEQALAKHGLVDHRTDVYALGMTLYELVTLHAAFRGQERHELLREIATEDPRPPRALNPAVPNELGTILLKALAKRPEERYATAQELADDLKRFLEDRPIQARPPTLRQKVAKWLRRHTVVVRAVLVVAGLTVVGLAAGSVVLWQERLQTLAALKLAEEQERKTADAKTRAEESAKRANDALEEARQKHAEARRVVDRMFIDVAEDWLRKEHGLEPLQETFLREALTFYVQEAKQDPEDPQVAAKTAVAYQRVADIQQHFGEVKEAGENLHHAIALLEALPPEARRTAQNREELGVCHQRLGHLLFHTGKEQEAEGELQQALDIEVALADDYPAQLSYREELARHYSNRATLYLAHGHLREASETAARGVQVAEQLVAEHRDSRGYLGTLASVLNNQGAIFYNGGRLGEAEKAWTRALEAGQKLAQAAPEDRETWDLMAAIYDYLGALYVTTGRVPASEPLWRLATEYRERLCDAYPHTIKYRAELAVVDSRFATVLRQLGKTDESELHYRRAIDLGEKLARDFPALTTYRAQRAKSYNDLGQLLQDRGKVCEAEEDYRRAVDLLEQQGEDGSADYLADLSVFQNNVGWVCLKTGRPQEAEPALRAALAARLDLVRRYPQKPAPPEVLPGIAMNLVRLLVETGRPDEAEQTYRQTLNVLERVCGDLPALTTYQAQRAQVHNELGHLLLGRGRLLEAVENQRRAVDLLQQQGEDKDRPADYLHNLSVYRANLGGVYWKAGRPQEAEQVQRAALATAQELARRFPQRSDSPGLLRAVATSLAAVLQATGRTEEADEILRKYAPPSKRLGGPSPQ